MYKGEKGLHFFNGKDNLDSNISSSYAIDSLQDLRGLLIDKIV